MSRFIYPSDPPFASPNFGERRGAGKPTLIVIHYTAMETCSEARERLCDPEAQVSSHWLISERGEAEALVDERHRAWHAGAGEWAGINDVNSASIGIELANTGRHPFPEPQMATLEVLLANVMQRWDIPPRSVIGHSDLAPDRKSDPGFRFDWRRLALLGLSVWPDLPPKYPQNPVDCSEFCADLHRFGYPMVDESLLLRAFRVRFRPWCDGPMDFVDAALAADLANRFPDDKERR